MSCLLVLFVLTLWGKSCVGAGKYCVHQPRGAESFVGADITLPCRFMYPEDKETVLKVTVIWKADNALYCGDKQHEFYNSLTNSTFPQYKERLLLVGDPKAQNASITLRNVATGDRNTYCCRIIIKYKGGNPIQFQSPEGTRLTVRGDNELSLEQPSLIPAFAGDTVTVLSRFVTKNQNIVPNIIGCLVRRSTGAGPECGGIIYTGTCAERPGRNIVHFKINHINTLHQGWYCWEIQVLTSDGKKATYQRTVGTKVLVVERTNYLDIWQPRESVFHNSAVINCIYSPPPYKDILWIGVYWMIGNPREEFVYHPNPDYIHPDYKGKTRLINESSLLLEEFHGPENTTFYCRVVIERCALHTSNGTKAVVIMEEGSGTRLKIYNAHDQDQCPQAVIIAVYAGIKVFILFVLSILALVYMKKK